MEHHLTEHVSGWSNSVTREADPDVWIGPPIPQEWGYAARPARHELNLYWNDSRRLHAHWVVRSGARIDASFAGMDEAFRSWVPTKAHLAVHAQAFETWSNYDCSENGEKIVQVPYLLRAVSGTDIDVAMEALQTLYEHLYHQDTVAGGVSLVLPVLARLSIEGLSLLSGSIDAFLSLAVLPHVQKILPDFSRPPRDSDESRQITYRLPEWGVFPNEKQTIVMLANGKRHEEQFTRCVELDHQQPFSDRTQIGWGQNKLKVNGEFTEIRTYENGVASGPSEVRVGEITVERGTFAPGSRQRQGKKVGSWTGAWPDGSPRFAADYVDGKREGIVQTFSIEGRLLTECAYQKNQRHGSWRQWFPNGQLVADGHFTRNVPSGLWKGFYPDGAPRFEGAYRQGLRFGPWRYWDRDGDITQRSHNYD